MVDPYELLFSGGIETVPDWFAGGDMLGAGRLCFRIPAWPTVRCS